MAAVISDRHRLGLPPAVSSYEIGPLKARLAEAEVARGQAERERDLLKTRVAVLEETESLSQQTREMNGVLAKQVAALRDALRISDDRLKRIESQDHLENLERSDLIKKAQFNDNQIRRFEELQTEKMRLEQKLSSAKAAVDENIRLKAEKSKIEKELADYKRDRVDQSSAIKLTLDLQGRVRMLEEDNECLRKRVHEFLQRENTHIHRNEEVAILQDRTMKLATELEDKNTSVRRLSMELQELVAQNLKIKPLETEREEMLNEIYQMRAVLSEVRANYKPNELSNMSQENKRLLVQTDDQRMHIERQDRELVDLRERFRLLQASNIIKCSEASKLEAIADENSRLASAILQLKQEHSKMKRERDASEAKASQAVDQEKRSLETAQSIIKGLEETVVLLKGKIEESCSTIASHSKDITDFEHKRAQLICFEDQLRNVTAERDSILALTTSLKNQVAQLNKELGDTKTVLSGLAHSKEVCQVLELANDRLSSGHSDLEQRLKLMQQAFSKSGNEINFLRKSLVEAETEVRRLRSIELDQKTILDTATSRESYLREQIGSFEKKWMEAENKINQMKSELTSREVTLKEIEAKLVVYEAGKLQHEENVSKSFKESEAEQTKLRSRISELVQLLDNLRQENMNTEAKARQERWRSTEENKTAKAKLLEALTELERIAELERNAKKQVEELRKAEERATIHEASLNTVIQERDELLNRVAKLERRLSDPSRVRGSAFKCFAASSPSCLITEIHQYQERVDNLESKFKHSQDKLRAAEEQLQVQEVKVQETPQAPSEVQEYRSQEIERLKEKLARATEERAKMKAEADRHTEDLRHKNADVQVLRDKLSVCLVELEKVKGRAILN